MCSRPCSWWGCVGTAEWLCGWALSHRTLPPSAAPRTNAGTQHCLCPACPRAFPTSPAHTSSFCCFALFPPNFYHLTPLMTAYESLPSSVQTHKLEQTWWEHCTGIFWKRHSEIQGTISRLVKGSLQLLLLKEESTFPLCLHLLWQSCMVSWINLITPVTMNCAPQQPQFQAVTRADVRELPQIHRQDYTTGNFSFWHSGKTHQSWNIRYTDSIFQQHVLFLVSPIFIGTVKKTIIPTLEVKHYLKK